jgi:hypothetical protein
MRGAIMPRELGANSGKVPSSFRRAFPTPPPDSHMTLRIYLWMIEFFCQSSSFTLDDESRAAVCGSVWFEEGED